MTMTDTADPGYKTAPEPSAPRNPVCRLLRAHRFGWLLCLAYVAGGFWVFAREWRDVSHRLVGDGVDHQLFVWFLAEAARSVTSWQNPLFSDRLNVPNGINLMANTSVLGLGIPMAPVTLLFGPLVTYAVLAIFSLAGTAAGWYYVFSRRLVRSKVAAAVGGAFCGFAPGMIAHAPGHLHVIAQFVLPFIVLFVLRLADPMSHTVRDGVLLGLLIAYQVFISEEMLLLTAFGCAGIVGAFAVIRPVEAWRRAWPLAKGLGMAAAVAGVLLAYPLWFQFAGPQHPGAPPFDASRFVSDVAAYVTFPSLSLAGDTVGAQRYAINTGEENAFFGWPLTLIAVTGSVWIRRSIVIRVLALAGLVLVALSLGDRVVVAGHNTGIPGLFRLIGWLPLVEMALPTRFSLVVVPIVGALLALVADRSLAARGGPLPTRLLLAGTLAVALVPLLPTPVPAFNPPDIPRFIAASTWRTYVPDGGTLVPVPLPRSSDLTGVRWAALSGVGFAVPRGYFIGPDGSTPPRGVFDPPPRPTSQLLRRVATTGRMPTVTDATRRAAWQDLAYWRAAVVVLPPQRHAAPLYATLVLLLGPGRWIDGCWIWDVRKGPR
jgi:hypothetical protein